MNVETRWAGEFLQKAKGDREKAVKMLHAHLTQHKELLEDIMSRALERALHEIVNVAAAESRKVIFLGGQRRDDITGVGLVADRSIHGLLETYYAEVGKALGQCTAADLRKMISRQESQATTLLKNVAFMRLLLAPIDGTDKKVNEAWTDKAAQQAMLDSGLVEKAAG